MMTAKNTRRHFLKALGLTVGGLVLNDPRRVTAQDDENVWSMPDEGNRHKRTWMAFGASRKIWGSKLLPEVQRNLATIARTISTYEPVSMLVRKEDAVAARRLVGTGVELIVQPLDDLWMRDTGPVFVTNTKGVKAGVDFNFNGWGEKQDHDRDAKVAQFVATRARALPIATNLVLEGGGIEVDGRGTAIITESCVLNDNRNPRLSKADCELELKRLLGLTKIIWLPGIKGKDITDGHTDFYARFAGPGVVVAGYDPDPRSYDHAVTKRHLALLSVATDAEGRKLDIVVIEAPSTVREKYANEEFAAGYINFYMCNGAVIAPEFGDAKADKAARDKLHELFPDRDIVQIAIDGIAAGGGGIHCTTQQELLAQ
ncbi:MAG: agmatine deiminase family protein [Anaerolineae bacterium]|nr:agmatine deiminase family protein [Anaerolineae bacterium]